jgi:hypothetical protein
LSFEYLLYLIKIPFRVFLPRWILSIYFRIPSLSRWLKVAVSLVVLVFVCILMFVAHVHILLVLGLCVGFFCLAVISTKFVIPHYYMSRATRLTKQYPPCPSHFTQWSTYPVKATVRKAVESADTGDEVLLGRIDQEGRVLCVHGELPFVRLVHEDAFLERMSNDLDIVLRDGLVLLKKEYGTHRMAFAREWYNLKLLERGAHVPHVWKADKKRLILYVNFIPGETFRDLLSRQGVAFETKRGYRGDRHLKVAGEIHDHISHDILMSLEQQMNCIHRCRIARLDIKVGNFLIGRDGNIYMLDFEYPYYLPKWIPFFYVLRDRDRELLNKRLSMNLLTERSVRRALHRHQENPPALGDSSMSMDFGLGLTKGTYWRRDASSAFWESGLRNILPDYRDKRILNLGLTEAVFPMLMLRHGAREVVCVGPNRTAHEWIRFIHAVFEWRDNRDYHLKIVPDNGLYLESQDVGPFDIITAFGGLTSFSDSAVAKIVQRCASLTPWLVVCVQKKASGAEYVGGDDDKWIHASMHRFYRNVEAYSPGGYPKSFLIGANG